MSRTGAPHDTVADAYARAGDPGYFGTLIEGRRGQILDAALAVFSEKGYEGGTMREIAVLVGVSEPALYRHYSGKEALLVDLVDTAGSVLASTAAAQLDAADPAHVTAALAALAQERKGLLDSNLGLMRTILFAAHHNAAARTAFQRAVSGPMSGAVEALIRRVDESRGISRPEEDLTTQVRLVISLFAGHLLTSRFFDAPIDDTALGEAMMGMLGWRP